MYIVFYCYHTIYILQSLIWKKKTCDQITREKYSLTLCWLWLTPWGQTFGWCCRGCAPVVVAHCDGGSDSLWGHPSARGQGFSWTMSSLSPSLWNVNTMSTHMNLTSIISVSYTNCNVICSFSEDEERKNFISKYQNSCFKEWFEIFRLSNIILHSHVGFLSSKHWTVNRKLPSLGSCSPTNTLKMMTFPALSPEYIFPPSSSNTRVFTCPRWSSISCFSW